MKKLLLSSVLLLFIFSTVWAEYVVLKDGRILEGKLLGRRRTIVYLGKDNEVLAIEQSTIHDILNDDKQSIMSVFWEQDELEYGYLSANSVTLKTEQDKTNYLKGTFPITHKIKGINIAVGFLSGFLAWDYFAEASDIQQNIDAIKKHDLDDNDYSSELKDDLKVTRTRKEVCGSVFAVVSFICFATSLEKVEIEASPTSLSLSYKF